MGFRLNSYSGPTWAGLTDITRLHLIVMIPLGRSHTENPEGYTPNRTLSHSAVLNHLVISRLHMHKRKRCRSCCQLLFLVSWIYGTTTVARRAYNEMTMLSKPKHPQFLTDIDRLRTYNVEYKYIIKMKKESALSDYRSNSL